MMMMTEAPADLFDVVVAGPGGTHDGELLGRLNDAPAGAWLAVVLESINVDALTAEDPLTGRHRGATSQPEHPGALLNRNQA